MTPKNVAAFFTLIIMTIIFIRFAGAEITYVKSSLDGSEYLVRNVSDSLEAANRLAEIKKNIDLLVEHLSHHLEQYEEYEDHIKQLSRKIAGVVISESSGDSIYTSYSVNKGEEIVFCIRSKEGSNQMHPLNLMMYVTLHELAHVACPEYGHTPLFKKIFAFLTNIAIQLQLYRRIDFQNNPQEYCGMTIGDSIV